jgi:hypothetical protein
MILNRVVGRRAVVLGVFVGVSLATRAPFLGASILDLDEAAALVGSQELLRGGTLYVDFVDNRPPLLYAFYALAGLVPGHGMFWARLLSTLVVLPLTAFAASAFYRHDRRGVAAGLLYLVYGAAFLAHDMHSVSPELLMLLPLGWAAVLLRDEANARDARLLFAAGALVGVSVLVRQQAGSWLVALAVAATAASARDRLAVRLGRLLSLVAGFALPPALVWALFASGGAGDALVYWTVIHNLLYARNPIAAAEAAERFASYLLPFLLATAPLWWASWRSRTMLEAHHQRVLTTSVLAFSLPAVFVGLRFFPHYFVGLYLPLALAAAPWTAAAVGRPVGRDGRIAVAWPLGLLAGFTVANLLLYRGPRRVYEETRPLFGHVAARLRADPCYGRGPLFVWGFAPQLYAEAALNPASRFVVPQASLVGYVPGNRASRSDAADTRSLIREDHWDRLMGDLERSAPTFVLDTAPSGLHGWDRYPIRDFPRLERFLKAGYAPVADVDGVWIWRRRDCATTGQG